MSIQEKVKNWVLAKGSPLRVVTEKELPPKPPFLEIRDLLLDFLKGFRKKAVTGFSQQILTFPEYMLYYRQVILSSYNPISCFCATGETMYIERKITERFFSYYRSVCLFLCSILFPQPVPVGDFLLSETFHKRVFTPQGVLSPLSAFVRRGGAGYGQFLAGNSVPLEGILCRGLLKMMSKRGQNIVEYAIVVSLVSAAMVAMSTYVYRAVQGTQKKIEDEFQKN